MAQAGGAQPLDAELLKVGTRQLPNIKSDIPLLADWWKRMQAGAELVRWAVGSQGEPSLMQAVALKLMACGSIPELSWLAAAWQTAREAHPPAYRGEPGYEHEDNICGNPARFGAWWRRHVVTADVQDRLRLATETRRQGIVARGDNGYAWERPEALWGTLDALRRTLDGTELEISGAEFLRLNRKALRDPTSRLALATVAVQGNAAAGGDAGAELKRLREAVLRAWALGEPECNAQDVALQQLQRQAGQERCAAGVAAAGLGAPRALNMPIAAGARQVQGDWGQPEAGHLHLALATPMPVARVRTQEEEIEKTLMEAQEKTLKEAEDAIRAATVGVLKDALKDGMGDIATNLGHLVATVNRQQLEMHSTQQRMVQGQTGGAYAGHQGGAGFQGYGGGRGGGGHGGGGRGGGGRGAGGGGHAYAHTGHAICLLCQAPDHTLDQHRGRFGRTICGNMVGDLICEGISHLRSRCPGVCDSCGNIGHAAAECFRGNGGGGGNDGGGGGNGRSNSGNSGNSNGGGGNHYGPGANNSNGGSSNHYGGGASRGRGGGGAGGAKRLRWSQPH